MENIAGNIVADVEAVSTIPIIATMLEVVCRTTGMGFAAVARVTEEKWVACAVRDEIAFGLQPGGELELETTICHEIRQSGQGVIIDNVEKDPLFCSHHTPKIYGFQSYISLPILLQNGEFFGTLCAIDPRPAKLNNTAIIGMFKLFAELISFHLKSTEDLNQVQTSLSEERKTAGLREQFIAVLGHDLRNPLNAIENSAALLLQTPTEEEVKQLAGIIKNSSHRMSGLIENTLDFARGRLGGGFSLNRKNHTSLEELLSQVIDELQLIYPDRSIETKVNIPGVVSLDATRIAQLFSNLLSNALKYGRQDKPVRITSFCCDGQFVLSVANSGDKIPGYILDRIFQPFSRGQVKPGQQGLGLGLYIAAEIAHAHGGQLEVNSTDEETRFTLRIPSE